MHNQSLEADDRFTINPIQILRKGQFPLRTRLTMDTGFSSTQCPQIKTGYLLRKQ